ncbi:FeoA family protein [Effusibacillus dendaii]|uniref:Ferrous iron transporter FeoA-like domain-containing protein n=1 Tax=Effusibacillus dendaii TaxID=2743772 RepID=A0A7I8DJX4_9BACL|nr:FeoA family protein [Effusibacillus dendaii]BCJ88181.1 hypothetical protein skT53_31660 [Effusibacillus dendaii]
MKVSTTLTNDAFGRRLMDLGLIPGTEVSVVRKAPFGDPIVVRFRGYQIGLRVSDAKRISVETVS